MQRRKFLATMGSLAAGSAAAMGTGAFTTVQANRSMSVGTADNDWTAQLAFDTENASNGEYASYASNGEIEIAANNLNVDARTQILDIFKVRNNGPQPVAVYVDPDSVPPWAQTDTGGFGLDPQASNRPNGDYTNGSSLANGAVDDQISLTGIYSSTPYNYLQNTGSESDESVEEFILESGQQFDFGLYVNGGEIAGNVADISMEIIADATVVPDGWNPD